MDTQKLEKAPIHNLAAERNIGEAADANDKYITATDMHVDE